MKAIDLLFRKILRPSSITVSDANLLSLPTANSAKSNLRNISETVSHSGDFSSHHHHGRYDGGLLGKESKMSNILKIYFDFAYYIGCCPFHFVVSNQNGTFVNCEWYVIKTWKPQQLCCALLHTIGMIRLFTEVRGVIPQTVLQSPEHYFTIIGGALRIIFKAVTIKRFWCNQKTFLDILNFMTVEKGLPDCHMKIQNKFVVSIFCGLCFVMPVIVALKINIVASPSTWNSTWWDRTLVSDGRFAFFIISRAEYNPSDTATIPDVEDISILDYFLGLLMGMGLVERLIMGFYFDASLLCGVLTLWTTSYAFSSKLIEMFSTDGDQIMLASLSSSSSRQKSLIFGGGAPTSLEDNKSEKWIELYRSYKGIRTLSQLINQAFGSMITTFLAESILYHSMNMDAVILTKDTFRQAYLLFFIVSSSLTYLYAADICNQMDSLKIWLSRDGNRKSIPMDELNIVLHELQTNVTGIRGSNIFTITYSLVWNMLTTVVTYFIICVQARVHSAGGGGGGQQN